MTKKKSLYEILGVRQDAAYPAIQASYKRLLQALESQQPTLSREDYNMQLRLLKVAYSTLSTPMSRDAYDAHLSTRSDPVPSSALVASPNASAAALRADAMLMRAEAMALRADALGLKADVVSGYAGGDVGASVPTTVQRLLSSFRTVLLTLGTLAALSMVLKVVFLFMATRQPDEAGSTRSQAEDKVFLQEYYQTYGVRPANRAEAALMDAERRKGEEAYREQKRADDDKRDAARAERNFEEESRRRGEQVSVELQYAEEKARQAQKQEEREKAEAEQMKAEAERQRLEAEQAKWRRVLERTN